MTWVILLFIVAILYCLGSGLIYLLKDVDSTRMVKALSWRVGLSLFLFMLLFVGFYFGWLHPHGIYPVAAMS